METTIFVLYFSLIFSIMIILSDECCIDLVLIMKLHIINCLSYLHTFPYLKTKKKCSYIMIYIISIISFLMPGLFTSLGGLNLGYTKAKVTPYMHAIVYVPRFLAELQIIKKFIGQGNAD